MPIAPYPEKERRASAAIEPMKDSTSTTRFGHGCPYIGLRNSDSSAYE